MLTALRDDHPATHLFSRVFRTYKHLSISAMAFSGATETPVRFPIQRFNNRMVPAINAVICIANVIKHRYNKIFAI